MLISMLRFAANGWIEELYIQPEFLFSYFKWLPRPNAVGMYALFLTATLSSIGILLGWRYRWSSVLFSLSFTYIELLDKSAYLNHYYFISLLAFVLCLLPANRAFSLDVHQGRVQAAGLVPRWTILVLQVMIGGLYLLAGVAKLNHAWLLEAMPLKMWLPPLNTLPLIGPLLDELWVAFFFSWVGMLYDLAIPFLLLYRKTRPFAYVSVVLFHGLTALFFPIGMFPFVMMTASLVFLEPKQIERILSLGGRITFLKDRSGSYQPSPLLNRIYKPALAVVLFLLLVFPFRYVLYPGNLFWTEEGYRFGWRVMLMEKAGTCFFYVKDARFLGEKEVGPSEHLTPFQEKQMSTQPDMILQFAHYLEEHYQAKGVVDPEVRVESWVSLNGEGSRLFIDPFVDLTEKSDGWAHKSWVLPYDSVVYMKDLRALKRELANLE